MVRLFSYEKMCNDSVVKSCRETQPYMGLHLKKYDGLEVVNTHSDNTTVQIVGTSQFVSADWVVQK